MAAGVLLLTYLILSLEDFAPTLRAAILCAVPAMWFVPALKLLSARGTVSIAIGLGLIANSVRLLVSRALSRRAELPVKRHRRKRYRLEGDPSRIFIFGAMVLQVGITWVWFGPALPAAILVGLAVATWTLAAMARGLYRPGKEPDSIPRAVFTLILAVALMGFHAGTTAAKGTTPQTAKRRSPTRVFSPAREVFMNGVEGVILRPEVVRQLSLRVARPNVWVVTPSRAMFGFTGEYRLYPASSRDLEKKWSVDKGSPIDVLYVTAGGGDLETEAYQELNPPIDFSACRALQVLIASHEGAPAGATLELVGDHAVSVGPEIFGLSGRPEETLEFALSATAKGEKTRGLRVRFRCIGDNRSKSLRVAVLGFRVK